MKYLVVFAAITILLATGCTKSMQLPTHAEIIASHTWYMKHLVIAGSPQNATCYLSEQLTFNKDSTGNHFYPTLCDSTQPSDLSFHWYIEDNTDVGNYYTGAIQTTTLYSKDIGGIPDSSTILRLFIINPDTLGMVGVVNGGKDFYALYTSAK